MGKTLLIFLLISYKLSICWAEASAGRLGDDYQSDDLLISEVLFNPQTGGSDFVEIYNPTSRGISLNGLSLGNIAAEGEIGNLKSLGTGMVGSGEYRVISKGAAVIRLQYYCPYPDRFIDLSSMPAYNNDSGHVILLRGGRVTDRLDYTEKMHHPLLKIFKGVSLERVSFELPANAVGNFTSAAASVGFATPGYANSVRENPALKKDVFQLSGKAFSPDGDGIDDVLTISWQLQHHGHVVTATIYSDRGILVRRLLKNESVATSGTLSWDGINENGQSAAYGIYVMVFQSFDTLGNSLQQKKAFALVGAL